MSKPPVVTIMPARDNCPSSEHKQQRADGPHDFAEQAAIEIHTDSLIAHWHCGAQLLQLSREVMVSAAAMTNSKPVPKRRRGLVMIRRLSGSNHPRDFDREFWQKLGPNKILGAAWEMAVDAHGLTKAQQRLQRTVMVPRPAPR